MWLLGGGVCIVEEVCCWAWAGCLCGGCELREGGGVDVLMTFEREFDE